MWWNCLVTYVVASWCMAWILCRLTRKANKRSPEYRIEGMAAASIVCLAPIMLPLFLLVCAVVIILGLIATSLGYDMRTDRKRTNPSCVNNEKSVRFAAPCHAKRRDDEDEDRVRSTG